MSAPVTVGVLRLAGPADLPLPAYMSPGAAGADVCAAVEAPVVLAPGERMLIPTGFALDVPEGYEVQIRPRSGLALRSGVTLLNSPGTIDSDYRGELKVILINHGDTTFVVQRGDRVAQLVLAPVTLASWLEVEELDVTTRGEGGFGSTGGLSALPG